MKVMCAEQVVNITIGDYEFHEAESYTIEYWYNRHTRDWVVQVFDNNDVEQDSAYCPNKEWRDSVIADYCKQYNTNEVKKV